MGSLLPGWDANRVVEGFDDEAEETSNEPLGYFAKLEKSRSMRPAEEAPFIAAVPHAYSLQRHSLVHEPSVRAKDPADRPSLRRISADPLRSASLRNSHLHTDWAEELRSLGGGHKVERTEAVKGQERWSFARHMEHSVLNEPAADEAVGRAKGFVPQFAVAGQPMQYAAPLAGAKDESP